MPVAVDIDAAEVGLPASEFDEPEMLEPAYGLVIDWWDGFLHKVIERRRGKSSVWCPRWWEHPEAIGVLMSLHEAWEGARAASEDTPDAMLTWWERLYGILPALMSRETGPFGDCQWEKHGEGFTSRQLPHEQPPEHYFGLRAEPA